MACPPSRFAARLIFEAVGTLLTFPQECLLLGATNSGGRVRHCLASYNSSYSSTNRVRCIYIIIVYFARAFGDLWVLLILLQKIGNNLFPNMMRGKLAGGCHGVLDSNLHPTNQRL